MGLMTRIMFESRPSSFEFAETVTKVREAAIENGWTVPQTFDLQDHYHHEGLPETRRTTIIYYCDSRAGSVPAEIRRGVSVLWSSMTEAA